MSASLWDISPSPAAVRFVIFSPTALKTNEVSRQNPLRDHISRDRPFFCEDREEMGVVFDDRFLLPLRIVVLALLTLFF